MAKLVFFKILGGDFKSGFFVNMQIFNEDNRVLIADIEGKLPPAQDLPNYYEDWQYSYRQMVSQRSTRVSLQNTAITNNEIISEIKKAKDNLHFQINNWLKPDGSFSPIWTALLSNLKDENEEIRVIFKTDDIQLRRLPLFTWEIFFEERYHRSEMGLYLPVKSKSVEIKNNQNKVKVLAVLGSTEINSNNTQLKIEKDWEMLKNLLSSESNAEVIPLMNPDLDELADTLDAQRPQILFFAGHSYTEDVKSIGRIVLSETETVTIEDLRFELIKAAKTGLKLAIFNSCNGIGIAQQLYKLQIPNIIVMREPLPDKVAHRFLQRFLEAFAAGKPLNLAVRRAREKLNRLERDFPGVMWLPMIWQNPAEPHLTWESIGGITTEKAVKHSIEENQETQGNNQPSMLWLETQISQSNPTVIQSKPTVIISEPTNLSPLTPKYSQSSSVSNNNTFLLLVGRYQITETIGLGGFGQTFLAKDKYLPNRPICVVKQMKVITQDPSILTIAKGLFETEANVLYQLGKHDQIPQLLAHFEENNQFYLVQEFIDGHDLTKEIFPRKLVSEYKIIELLQQVLKILEFIHENNIIHRDIKPSNLIRRKQDEKLVLIDFGAVKEILLSTTKHPDQKTVASTTISIGTPGYMASEQAQGKPQINSDIYSLGMIAIHALTGAEPNRLPSNNTGEINWQNQANVSSQLAQIIDKMVRFDYRNRYQSAKEVLKDLNALKNKSKKFNVLTSQFNLIQVLSIFLILAFGVTGAWLSFKLLYFR